MRKKGDMDGKVGEENVNRGRRRKEMIKDEKRGCEKWKHEMEAD